MELNPNHPTTRNAAGEWHKFMAVLMCKIGQDHVVISEADVSAFIARGPMCVVVKDGENGDGCMHFRLVSWAEGERLAREEGGLPA